MRASLFLILLTTNAFSFTRSSLREHGCKELDRRICKNSLNGVCEAVYIPKESSSEECKALSPEHIENTCGSSKAKLYKSDSECVGAIQDKTCPDKVAHIKSADVERLYTCKSIHLGLCKKVCGNSFTQVDIRQFYQTARRPGITCIDGNPDVRSSCLEQHRGNDSWCVNYNYSINEVSLGAFVQCVGKMK